MPSKTQSKYSALTPDHALRLVAKTRQLLWDEIHKVIIGQDAMVEQMLITLFAGGHCLAIGAPGLAKTLAVSTLARAMHMKFRRIQCTADLMPSDITGTEIIAEDATTNRRVSRFVRGPIFANFVLADEINCAPPKTQAVLLQSMQEYQVTAAGTVYDLELPFFVMATRNPIERTASYPLTEAQLDRFMLSIDIGYPSRDEEREIAKATTRLGTAECQPVLRGREILGIQQLVRQTVATDHIVDYAVDLVRASRPHEAEAPEFVKNRLSWGAGPRAVHYLLLGAKARAILQGRLAVQAEDIRALAHPVLRHRIVTNFHADAEGVSSDGVIDRLLESVREPAGEQVQSPPMLIVVPNAGRKSGKAAAAMRAESPAAAAPTPGETSQPILPPQVASQEATFRPAENPKFQWPPGAGDGSSSSE